MSEQSESSSNLPRHREDSSRDLETRNAPNPDTPDMGPSVESTQAPAVSAPKTSDRGPRWFGIIVIIAAFGFVGGWGATAAIDGAVVAQGSVTVDSYRKTIQHLEGGIVQSLHVRDGDIVERGDLLIQLDETQARARYLMKKTQHLAELGRMARLQAELDGSEAIDFPDELLDRVDTNPRAARVVRNERRQFETRRDAMEGEISVLRQRIDQLEERVKGLQAQRASQLTMSESLTEELASRGRLAERELMASSEMRPLERQLAEVDGKAGELRASIAEARMQAGETELEIIQLERESQREIAAQLRETTSVIDSLEEELRGLEDTLRRTQIQAPVGGEVVNMRVHSERGVIRAGEPILDIVPRGEPLVIEGRVRPQDIDSVTRGMQADVRFTAFSFRSTPVVEGEVTFASADSLEDENNGEEYYLVRVQVPESEMDLLGDVHLRPGMPADLMIKTGERTPLQYLLKPLTDAIARSMTES